MMFIRESGIQKMENVIIPVVQEKKFACKPKGRE